MHTRRITRSFAVMATVIAFAVSAIALPAVAKGPKAGRGPRVEHVKNTKAAEAKSRAAAKKAAAQARKAAAQARKAAAKARKAARFVATGPVVAVGDQTLTMSVVGGTKALRGTAVLVSVPADVRINRDDVPVTLADLQVGDHVAVRGSRVEGVLVAARVNATSPEPVIDEPTEDVTETVTEDPTETVTETVTEDPTETVTETVTETPVP